VTEHTRRDPAPEESAPSGCGVQGCLFAAVALFVVLLIGLLIVAAIRFSSPPQPRFGMAGPERAAGAAPPEAAPAHRINVLTDVPRG
jgi:hypothetical protein